MYINKTKNQKGITLVALVITVIVLLILAGVTINLTLGERGIFTTAQKAVENYKTAQEKELASLNNFEDEMNNTINGLGSSTPKQAVTKIDVTPTTSELEVGENVTLAANVQPSNAFNSAYTWSSSNEAVATVDATGKVTAVAAGTATIYATALDGSGVKGSCIVITSYSVGETITLGGVDYYVMESDESSWVKLLRVQSYGSYTWEEAKTEGTNYASSLGYTSDQATSRLITYDEAEELSRSMRTTGSYYWTSSAYEGSDWPYGSAAWDVNYEGYLSYIGTDVADGVRPVLVILKSLI